jgi:hypothetical protein
VSEALRVAACDGIGTTRIDDRNRAGQLHQDRNNAAADGEDCVRAKFDKVGRCGANEVHVVAGPALVELGVDAGRPTKFSQFLSEGAYACLHFEVAGRVWRQNPDPPHAVRLLRTRCKRPRRRRAAEKRDELSSPNGRPPLADDYTLPRRVAE